MLNRLVESNQAVMQWVEMIEQRYCSSNGHVDNFTMQPGRSHRSDTEALLPDLPDAVGLCASSNHVLTTQSSNQVQFPMMLTM